MDEAINLADIYDKNLNFLIGSGASAGLFPTLALKIRDDAGQPHSLETLATWLEERNDQRLDWLFAHYYSTCIRPAQTFSPADVDSDEKRGVLANYERFLSTVLLMLQKRKPLDKRCNIFTTNYDGCFAQAADSILGKGADDFALNDGARGFRTRFLQARNFNTYLCQTGVFERTLSSVPQINLIQLHGSVFWRKADAGIEVNYVDEPGDDLVPAFLKPTLNTFSATLQDAAAAVTALTPVPMAPPVKDAFWAAYKKLPIVNPTKWKFHETVFEEHYYQMLRLLSYELEKPNAVLITFGFSFADEHILNLIQRSLSNPTLQVFVCCYSESEFVKLSAAFKTCNNVKCIALSDAPLNFQAFNDRVFSPTSAPKPGAISPTAPPAPPIPVVGA